MLPKAVKSFTGALPRDFGLGVFEVSTRHLIYAETDIPAVLAKCFNKTRSDSVTRTEIGAGRFVVFFKFLSFRHKKTPLGMSGV